MRRPIDLPPRPDPPPFDDPIAMALYAIVCEQDPRGLSAANVAARAGVTLVEFHQRYASVDACLVDSFERAIASYEHDAGSAFNSHSEWRAALRAAAYTTAAWIEEHPLLTEFGTTGVLGIKNEMVRVMREEVLLFCAQMIDSGREEATDPASVPEPAAMMATSSVFELLAYRIQERVPFDPWKIVPEMMYGIVRVYLGDEAADEELVLPPPVAPRR